MILDLCGGGGNWGKPYRDSGLYYVINVDPQGRGKGVLKERVEDFLDRDLRLGMVHGRSFQVQEPGGGKIKRNYWRRL